ncbi:MAG: outer membrane beta-barrel protein [Acidobacteria bacterium]|nr:outer membrane beta-barrel protein [Acidobacteriota bacterium]
MPMFWPRWIRLSEACLVTRMPSARWAAITGLAVLIVTLGAAHAGAQTLRIQGGPAEVYQWRDAGDAIAVVQDGAQVELLQRDGDWVWVVLPADANGTRKAGWLRDRYVQPVDAGAASAAIQPAPQPSRPSTQTPRPRKRDFPWFAVEGIGGASFGVETAEVYGGGVGYYLAENVLLTLEFGELKNVVPDFMRDDAQQIADATEVFLLQLTGRRFQVRPDARLPVRYGVAGAKFLRATPGRIRPYVAVGAGFARLRPNIRFSIDGQDITNDGVRRGQLPVDQNELLGTLGGGLAVRILGGLSADLAYRYGRVFTDPGIDINRVHVGIGYAF